MRLFLQTGILYAKHWICSEKKSLVTQIYFANAYFSDSVVNYHCLKGTLYMNDPTCREKTHYTISNKLFDFAPTT